MPSPRICAALGCVFVLAAACTVDAATAGAKYGSTLTDCLKRAGLTKLTKVVEAAGLTPYFSTTYQVNTLLAPTNDAITSLYKTLQLTEAQALANKQLMKQILQYNTLPYVRRLKYWPTYGNGVKKQKTLVPGLKLRLYQNANGRYIAGGFANDATVLNKPHTYDLVCGQSVMHITNEALIPIVVA